MTDRTTPEVPAQRGGTDTSAPGVPGADEDALRALLHGAVDELAPRPGALDHLRYAVPARRARRRQMTVGAAALLVLAVASVPALVRSGAIGTDGGKPVTASSSHASPEAGQSPDGDTAGGGGSESPGSDETGAHGDSTQGPDGKDGTAAGGGSGDKQEASAPACQAGDIQEQGAQTDPPDSQGNVTGEITMVNRSTKPCTVSGTGTVQTAAVGADIDTTEHTAGDDASDLLPPTTSGEITLAAGESYVVAFAFVPAPEAAEICPADGGGDGGSGGEPSPEPSQQADTTAGESGETLSDTSTQLMYTDTGGTGDSSPPPAETTEVVVTHTPEAGGETATVTVEGTCAGTVYYTPPLEA